MSETNETPRPGESEPAPAPQPAPEPAPAPDAEPAEQTEEQEQRQRDAEGRRVAQLRARLGAAEREQMRQREELEFWRRQAQGLPQGEETAEQQQMRLRQDVRREVETEIRRSSFHQQGEAAFGDWGQKCKDLVAMGADNHFAELLVEMPDGARVAAALAEDPEAVERIANIRSPQGRAIALGKYAARLDGDGGGGGGNGAAAPVVRNVPVSRAPAPIRPVTGRAAAVFDEYRADANKLAVHYAQQDMERRMRR